MPGWNPEPSSIQITRMLRRPPPVKVGFTPMIKNPAPPALKMPRSIPIKRAFGGGIPEQLPDHPLAPIVGPINTSDPGRGDQKPVHVQPGSYVLDAATVGHLGEGNTRAGLDLLTHMFLPQQAEAGRQLALMKQGAPYGAAGGAPYGASLPPMHKGGVGIPEGIKPRITGEPRFNVSMGPMGQQSPVFSQPASAHGGVVPGEPGSQFLGRVIGQRPGTPINISGGEFVIPPDAVKRIGRGDVSWGHEILDNWVNKLRQDHIKTLKRLPGPAK